MHEGLKAFVETLEGVKEGVKAYVAGNNAIIEGRVAEGMAKARADIAAELEAAGMRAKAAEDKAAEIMAAIDKDVADLKADADEIAAAVAAKTPAAAEPVPSDEVAEVAAEVVSEPAAEGEVK